MINSLVFGKYEIQQRLAVGGMGEVFFAKQVGLPGFERPAILKSLLPDLAEDQSFVDQFLDEARVAATLNHPNVVSIYEVGLWNGTYFIAMEYIRGRNLAQIIRRSLEQGVEISITACLRIIAEAALGLHHAHHAEDAQGQPLHIVHRDISPQNIMVREDGVTKVVDFGIARAANRVSRTATGTMKGKLAYMPPEQILGKTLSAAADQWALGVCFWELLSRKRLFRGESDMITAKKVLEGPIPPPERADVPPEVIQVLMRTLERDEARRYPSCGALAEALQVELNKAAFGDTLSSFMRRLGTEDLAVVRLQPTPSSNFVISLGGQKSPESATQQHGDPAPQDGTLSIDVDLSAAPRSRAPLMLGLAALVAVAGAAATYFVVRPSPQPPPVVAAVQPPEPVVPPPPVKDPPIAAPVVVAPAALGTLKLTSVPAKVTVRIDGRVVGTTPLEVPLASDAVHYLQAEASGFRRLEREVKASPGEVLPLTLTLVAIGRAPAVATPAVVVGPSTEPGFLTLQTTPWSKVSVDGEPIGSTPIFKRKLAPGSHRLQLVNEGEGINTTRSVIIAPGQTQKLSLQLK